MYRGHKTLKNKDEIYYKENKQYTILKIKLTNYQIKMILKYILTYIIHYLLIESSNDFHSKISQQHNR